MDQGEFEVYPNRDSLKYKDDYGLDEIMGNLLENTWEEYENSEKVKEVRLNGSDLCDYCEEGIDYVNSEKWEEWRRPQQLK